MSSIKDLPVSERPREKAIRYGITSLSNQELLSMIIQSGGKENSAISISYHLLEDNLGLVNLFHLSSEELQKYKGIGKAKALKLSACFELLKRYYVQRIDEELTYSLDPDSLYKKYIFKTFNCANEKCYLIVLNRQKKIIKEDLISSGDDKNVLISSNEIIRTVLISKGVYFYIIHNHPNGILKPSDNDISFTMDLIKNSKKMKIYLLDHFIYTEEGYYSICYDYAKLVKKS